MTDMIGLRTILPTVLFCVLVILTLAWAILDRGAWTGFALGVLWMGYVCGQAMFGEYGVEEKL